MAAAPTVRYALIPNSLAPGDLLAVGVDGAIEGWSIGSFAVRGTVANAAALVPLSPMASAGDMWIATNNSHIHLWNGSAWIDLGLFASGNIAEAVSSEVAGLPQLAEGPGTLWDDSTPGILRPENVVRMATNSAVNFTASGAESPVVSFPISSLRSTDYFDLSAGIHLGNTGAGNRDWTFRLKIGSSTLATFAFAAVPQGQRAVRLLGSPYIGEFLGSPAWLGTLVLSISGANQTGADLASQSRQVSIASAALGASTPLVITAEVSAPHATLSLAGAGTIRRSKWVN